MAMLEYLKNIVQRLWRWKNRTISGDEEWEIPLPFGRTHFENLLTENVNLVELSTLAPSERSKLNQDVFGNLENDNVALLVRSESDWPLYFFRFLFPQHWFERFFIFYGRYEMAESGLVIRGTYSTDGWYRWHKQLLLRFTNVWLGCCAVAMLIYPIVIIQEVIEDPSLLAGLVIALIMLALYPLVIIAILAWGAVGVYFARINNELLGMGKLGRPLDVYWLLLRCAGWDENSLDTSR